MAILRIDAVLQETGERSKTSIYNRVKEGVFTKSSSSVSALPAGLSTEVKTIVAAAGGRPDT